MRKKDDIRPDLIAALEEVCDEELDECGFKRRGKSQNYIRRFRDANQKIAINVVYNPYFSPGDEVYFRPAMVVKIKALTESVLRVIRDETILVADAPQIVMNQPIEFAAPRDKRVQWTASGADEIKERVREIVKFARKWVVPFLDEFATPDDVIRLHERKDKRILGREFNPLYVAAAHILKGECRQALATLERDLGLPGQRSRYAVAYETIKEMLRKEDAS